MWFQQKFYDSKHATEEFPIVHWNCNFEKNKLKLTREQKELFARWFNTNHKPDYDGYCSYFELPGEIMEVYRELFPNDWN